jgi:steroid 5-alpha reductase family enzyme
MFKYTRNPNYLGEMLLYASFALMVGGTLVWSVLVFMWGVVFSTNIYVKDWNSLCKKEGWDKYEKNTNKVFPRIFKNSYIDNAFYFFVFCTFYQLKNL